MIFKLSNYHISTKFVLERQLKAFKNTDPYEIISIVSGQTGCHLLAVLLFYKQLVGPSEKLDRKIENTMKHTIYSRIEE